MSAAHLTGCRADTGISVVWCLCPISLWCIQIWVVFFPLEKTTPEGNQITSLKIKRNALPDIVFFSPMTQIIYFFFKHVFFFQHSVVNIFYGSLQFPSFWIPLLFLTLRSDLGYDDEDNTSHFEVWTMTNTTSNFKISSSKVRFKIQILASKTYLPPNFCHLTVWSW